MTPLPAIAFAGPLALVIPGNPFLNAAMLAGLVAVSIPIIIHILNRRRAHVVDWGAMQFLETSLTSRSRRILIEEIILMALRCLLLALLALALARPYFFPGRLLASSAADAQDIAIVLDGSLSMTLRSVDPTGAAPPAGTQPGGVALTTRFDQAVAEARQVIRACRPADAVSLIVAGAAVDPIVAKPISDRRIVESQLLAARPTGGSLDAPKGLNEAIRSLAAGRNAVKKVIFITDAQQIGWDLSAEKRWSFLAEEARESLPTPPTFIVRTLDPPNQWRNAAVTQVNLDRVTVGTDREVTISVTVANTGVGTIEPKAVELVVDGVSVERRAAGEIAAGASTTVVFEHRFEQSGPHIVAAIADCPDDLPGDNRTVRVVNVLESLPVLVIEGAHSARPLGSDAAFLRLALAPPDEDANSPAEPVAQLIRPTVVAATDIARVKDFEAYRVVILADVPRLPKAVAAELARFVAAGAGLLVAPGDKADKPFYDNWNGPDERRLIGCRLLAFDAPAADGDEDEPCLRVVPNSIDHPAVKLLADPSVSDLAAVRIRRRWVVEPDVEQGVAVGAWLDSGEPFLVQRKLGKGFVLTLSVPLDNRFSDLPVHKCYVPMVHELVYYLAAPSQQPVNLQPGQRIACAVPGRVVAGDVAEVVAPDGRRWRAQLQRRRGRWQATYAHTAVAGLYRLSLPDAALGELATRPALAAKGDVPGGLPFVVLGSPDESWLEPLSEADYTRAGEFVDLKRAETLSELIHAIRGGLPVTEIWRILALVCAVLLGAEILTTRAIAVRRQVHTARPVAFGADQVDADRFRADARATLATRAAKEESVK